MDTEARILGHVVLLDGNVAEGVYYLTRIINYAEAKVFFDEAYRQGTAPFEDRLGNKFKLTFQSGEYHLDRA